MSDKRRRKVNHTGRSEGSGRFVQLHLWLLRSAAWQSLSPPARSIYVELGALYNGSNNGELYLSVRKAARLINVSKTTAARGFKELTGSGFIRPRQEGAFDWKARHATSWILTEHSFAGHLATKEFMRWQPEKKKNTVPPVGQTVPLAGHMALPKAQKAPICPSHGTDNGKSPPNLSRHRDTYSLPGGVAVEQSGRRIKAAG